MLGDGILHWDRSDGNVHHPLLLQRLHLDFDPEKPQYVFRTSELESHLYTVLLSSLDDVAPQAVSALQAELADAPVHPLGQDDTAAFLKQAIHQLSSRGRFLNGPGDTSPSLWRQPIIFERSRTLGLAHALDSIIKDIQAGGNIPDNLQRISGIEPSSPSGESLPVADDGCLVEPEDILFGKPANPEQVRTARDLDRHSGVLVQGPPGTGKTHAIANLLGHLLAQGKRVLVSSHTTRALRVLKGQVVEPLQPLCVSVLECDLEGRRQRESSGSIHDRDLADCEGPNSDPGAFIGRFYSPGETPGRPRPRAAKPRRSSSRCRCELG